MGGQKPHLLVRHGQQPRRGDPRSATRRRPSSTSRTSAAGRPWITRLPFPVHVVERVETYDRISGNRFVTRYAYHHGYFDGDGARVPRLRHGRAVGHRGARALAGRRMPGRPTSTPPRTCRRCSPAPGSTPAPTSAAATSRTTSPDCATRRHAASTTASPAPTDAAARPAAARPTRSCRPGSRRTRSARPAGRSRARCCARRCTPSTAPTGSRTRTRSPSRTSRSRCCSRGRATATRSSSPTPARRSRAHYERDPAEPPIRASPTR